MCRLLASWVCICAFALSAPAAFAQDSYPSKPIRLIVPFTPGTSIDILARVVAERFTRSMGRQVIVENRAGAGGIIGTEAGAKAPPDGHTLTMAASGAFAVNPSLYPKLPYDPKTDFEHVAVIASVPQVLVTSADSKFQTLKEFVEAARQNPSKLTYASLGSGTTSHLTMEMFRTAANIEIVHVAFKGTGEAQTQLLGGHVNAMFDPVPATRPNILAGKLRALGVAASARSPFLPDVPTIAESGYPGFEAVGWIGLAAPRGTPKAIVDKLNAEVNDMLKDESAKEKLASLAFTPIGGTRQKFSAFIESEIDKWGQAVKMSGAKAE